MRYLHRGAGDWPYPNAYARPGPPDYEYDDAQRRKAEERKDAMTKPMTRDEMCEAIQRVVELLDTALDGVPLELNDGKPYRRIGTVQGLLANVLAALEVYGGKEPLAVLRAQWNKGGRTIHDLHPELDSCLLFHEGACEPVRVIILPAKEEPAL